MNSNSKDGQKRCKCKRSKCLKLYCDCFASGLFCDETCACIDCFNNPDYEDTVEETRKQIQLRNPIAFSSKIHCLVEPTSYNIEDGDRPELISGKHRRGCNCKKSMCQKKYCECYQASVRCCDECRCQGCKNVFGQKADHNLCNESIHHTVKNEMHHTIKNEMHHTFKNELHHAVKNEMQSIGSEFSQHEFNDPHQFTHRIPFQHLGHENVSPTTGRYIPSPGPANSDTMLGTSASNFDMVSLHQQAYFNASMNQFTPPDATHFNTRHFTSVMNIPPMMDLPYGYTTGVSYPSGVSGPGSLMTPVNVFSGPTVLNFNERTNTGDLVHNYPSPGYK